MARSCRPVSIPRRGDQMHARLAIRLAVLAMFGLAAPPAAAQIVQFYDVDVGAGPGAPRPNSTNKATAFDAAASLLGPLNIIDFESAPLGNFGALALTPSVSASLTATAADANPGISNTAGSAELGYNTTSAGNRYLRVVP